MKNISKALLITALFGGVSLGLTSVAHADLVVNGSFESTGTSLSTWTGGSTVGPTGWNSSGYNFLFTPGSADTTGVNGVDGNLKLWGPNDGSNNGLPATSPDGGNYIGADGAYSVGAITQTLSALTIGQTYAVSFYYAAAQQSGYTSTTTEGWTVGLGGSAKQNVDITTAGSPLPSHGFSGWISTTLDFTADSTSDVLSFLAYGTPSSEPPFSLLDGVSVDAVAAPEPSSLIGGGLVLLALGGSSLLRFRKQKQA